MLFHLSSFIQIVSIIDLNISNVTGKAETSLNTLNEQFFKDTKICIIYSLSVLFIENK